MEDKKNLNNYIKHLIIKYKINEGYMESINLALAGAALDETIISLAALINTGVVAIDILKLIKEEIIYFFNNHYDQDISKKSLELKILYNKYIKELSNYLKEKNIENPISIGIYFTNMLWDGNLSYTDKFAFKNSDPGINLNLLGVEVIKGEAVCRHIASLLVDIYKYLGYESELLLVKQYTSLSIKAYATLPGCKDNQNIITNNIFLPKSDREIPILLFAEILSTNTSPKILEISTYNCTFVIKIYT